MRCLSRIVLPRRPDLIRCSKSFQFPGTILGTPRALASDDNIKFVYDLPAWYMLSQVETEYHRRDQEVMYTQRRKHIFVIE